MEHVNRGYAMGRLLEEAYRRLRYVAPNKVVLKVGNHAEFASLLGVSAAWVSREMDTENTARLAGAGRPTAFAGISREALVYHFLGCDGTVFRMTREAFDNLMDRRERARAFTLTRPETSWANLVFKAEESPGFVVSVRPNPSAQTLEVLQPEFRLGPEAPPTDSATLNPPLRELDVAMPTVDLVDLTIAADKRRAYQHCTLFLTWHRGVLNLLPCHSAEAMRRSGGAGLIDRLDGNGMLTLSGLHPYPQVLGEVKLILFTHRKSLRQDQEVLWEKLASPWQPHKPVEKSLLDTNDLEQVAKWIFAEMQAGDADVLARSYRQQRPMSRRHVSA